MYVPAPVGAPPSAVPFGVDPAWCVNDDAGDEIGLSAEDTGPVIGGWAKLVFGSPIRGGLSLAGPSAGDNY